MTISLRRGIAADASACGPILYEAFKAIGDKHNFPPDFPSAEFATERAAERLEDPGVYAVVAEMDGRVVGSNFLDERSIIRGVGPITVDPTVQNVGVGKLLMKHVIARAEGRGAAGVRLLQAGFHNRSLSLYSKLGFRTREPVSILQGEPLGRKLDGYEVRTATAADVEACNLVCRHVHGFDRGGELQDAVGQGSATLVEHAGRITGYATAIAFFGHAVAMTNRDLMALVGAATAFPGPGFLLPTRNHEVLVWCLNNDLKLVYQMTLMTMGLYNEPNGAYLPSVLF
jgi:predicted N-acetyltransferase YhbS